MGHWREQVRRFRLITAMSLAVLVAAVLVGCGGPRPPVLQQGKELYRNTRENFHFRPPRDWTQQGLLDPSHKGPARDLMLVKYKRQTEARAAFFSVWVDEVPADTDLAIYLAKRSPDKNWKRLHQTENLEVDHLPAIREFFNGVSDRDATRREVVAVQRRNRVYRFVGDFSAGDDAAKQQIRDVVESVVWEGEPK